MDKYTKFFIPVHGEYHHIVKHAKLAESIGMPKENIFISEIGQVLEFTRDKGQVVGKVTSGKVLIDGLGVGDVGNIVLRDRRQLSQDGILIVVVTMDKEGRFIAAGPDIVSRGFVYVRESEALMEEAKERVTSAIEHCLDNDITEWSVIKNDIREAIGRYLYEKTRRRPMILPIIIEDLIYSYLMGDISEEGRNELLQWLETDDAHKQRLSEMADCWATAHVPLFASDMKADFQKHFGTLIDPAIPSEKNHWLNFRFLGKVAASVSS